MITFTDGLFRFFPLAAAVRTYTSSTVRLDKRTPLDRRKTVTADRTEGFLPIIHQPTIIREHTMPDSDGLS